MVVVSNIYPAAILTVILPLVKFEGKLQQLHVKILLDILLQRQADVWSFREDQTSQEVLYADNELNLNTGMRCQTLYRL